MRIFLSAGKRRIMIKSFIESQFKYCPLTWVFCSRKSNHKINRLYERSLRIDNNDYENTCKKLLSYNNCFYIHDQKIHCLATEIYKVVYDLSVGARRFKFEGDTTELF